jgi:hypothetical protein
MRNIEKEYAQFVAVADANVVGWCDVIPKQRQVYSHCGVLGMGLLPEAAGKLGLQLPILQAGSDDDLNQAFASLTPMRVSGLVIG